MCGIAGYHSKRSADREVIEHMTDAISHRGPDAHGIYVNKGYGIGHRRLSIIDLSEEANQPMHSKCGRYCIVYNGEVYNYLEIAKDLNVALRTNSDTEVILEAFAQWGADMVTRLNGMFAIAILDKDTGKLHLFRDRIGIKPLFIYRNDNLFGFASELKCFQSNKHFSLSINRKAIPSFLHLGYIPEPDTIYNECSKFPSGHYGVYDGKTLTLNKYWAAEDKISSSVISDEEEVKSSLKELLLDSVTKRLVSDVPFGTFLSGGIDSSLVTALAQKVSSERIKTFSIGFSESSHDESHFAKKISEYLGTEHYEYKVSESDAIDLIPVILNQYDEPFADSSAIPTMLVSKMARQEVTMTLSGDGGDELFHGYGSYNWAERLSRPQWKYSHNIVGEIASLGSSRYKRIGKLLSYENLSSSHVFSQEQYLFTSSEVSKLMLQPIPTVDLVNTFKKSFNRSLSPAEAQAFFDLQYYLKDDLLTKVDRASMRFSLETRVPLLDHRIIEFALNISPDLKMKSGVQKYILKQVLFNEVPEELFNRPKWGFSIPLNKWLSGPLKMLLDETLSESNVGSIGLVKWKEVEKLKNRFLNGENYLYNRLWLLICLHNWFLNKGL